MNILVAEDKEMNYIVLREILRHKNITCENACDGIRAVEMLREATSGVYDAIFMDIRMPRMDGLEATRKIRSMDSEYAKNIPIIALSAEAGEKEVASFFEAGMDDYLIKPYDVDTLYEKIRKLLTK